MDERKEPYIEQQAAEDALYTRLQQQTLAEVQRMSGKVWTDYNAHDPGVTLADIANYALAELDYKLGFGVADSLTEAGKPFDAVPARGRIYYFTRDRGRLPPDAAGNRPRAGERRRALRPGNRSLHRPHPPVPL